MNLPASINAKLLNDGTVSGLIGTRIYPEYIRLADKVLPYAIYKIEDVSTQLASDGPTGLQSGNYVIAAVATTHVGARQLADAIKAVLNGLAYSDTPNLVTVQGIFLNDDGRSENVVTNPDTEVILAYVCELTFLVWYNGQ